MPTFRSATVSNIRGERKGLQTVEVDVEATGPGRAYVLTELLGPVAVGDEVILNTTAVDLDLGTGGYHFVHWNLSRGGFNNPGPDHIMKLRYTSLQHDAGTSELEHPDLPTSLEGTPVVVCSLHSQMGVVAAVLSETSPRPRVSYVMTDGAALPLALSELVADLSAAGLLCGSVTAGHAFGGDLEAVSVASALLLAKEVQSADVIIVAMGPGVVGTGTKYGTTSVEAAHVLDLVDSLEGRPVLCIRESSGDGRERHSGVSHHTKTVMELARAPYAISDSADIASGENVSRVEVARSDAKELLDRLGLNIKTMGRGPSEDPAFFDACADAANVAALLFASS